LVGSKINQIIWLKLPYIWLHQPNFSKCETLTKTLIKTMIFYESNYNEHHIA